MNITQTTIIEMTVDEFDALVHEHYPKRSNFCLQAEQEMGNDDTLTFDVQPLTPNEVGNLKNWAGSEEHPLWGVGPMTICADFVRKGLFPMGRVVINPY